MRYYDFSASRIAVIYAASGILWLLCSDNVMYRLVTNQKAIGILSITKGCLFVAITSVLLYSLIHRSHRILQQRNADLLRLNEEIRESQANLQALISAIPDMIFRIHRSGVFLEGHVKSSHYLLAPEGWAGNSLTAVLPADLAQKTLASTEMALTSKTLQTFEYQLKFSGEFRYYEARISACGEQDVVAIVRDITARKHMEAQLQYLGLHDTLTALYNRSYFEETLRRADEAGDSSVGMIICDFDGLRVINDTLGHAAGDNALKAVAGILQECFPFGEPIARIGGDEFAIVLFSNIPLVFEEACRRIRTRITRHNGSHSVIPLSVSMGFSLCTATGGYQAMFKEANNNMYREKLHHSQSTKSAIVQTLMKALEARDFITEGHGVRLQDLVVAMARAMGLPEQNQADLRLFAQFHDIGKVGIPDHILLKPARLTEEEFAVMQQHCEIGYRIAKASPDLEPIADWILRHQEWWDGTGYPLGNKGDQIPMECRILAIADAYDAMTNDRPYRQAMPVETAIAELRQCAGTQFDPALVEPFVQLVLHPAGT